jgi:flagellar hook-length control protein FliK
MDILPVQNPSSPPAAVAAASAAADDNALNGVSAHPFKHFGALLALKLGCTGAAAAIPAQGLAESATDTAAAIDAASVADAPAAAAPGTLAVLPLPNWFPASAATASSAADSADNAATARLLQGFGALSGRQPGRTTAAVADPAQAEDKPAPVADGASGEASIADASAQSAAVAIAALPLPNWLSAPVVGPTAPGVRSKEAGMHDAVTTAQQAAAVSAKDLRAAPAERGEATLDTQATTAMTTAFAAHDASARVTEQAALPEAIARAAAHAASTADGTVQTPQHAFTQIVTAAPTPAIAASQPALDAPVGTPNWNTELGQKIVWMVGDKQQVAELRVNPPELGPLDIKLTTDGQQTTAVFTSPHSAVREAVESALPRLREILADSGIMLGNASVTADTPRDGQPSAAPRTGSHTVDRRAADADPAAPPARVVSSRGLVDLFA